ncbi:MAG: bifunctional oligoribonuclease/PAP phosphatase NrnA [Clostridia bacterium]|nr:bifunctional oligoribonuclease/PAP phosphatase NrnA [Clostridia bacterium]
MIYKNNARIKRKILNEIKKADTVILCRHKRPDGDAVGSTMGLAEIISASFPEKRVFLDNEDYSEYLAFLGSEGPRPSDEDYKNALVIVLDTGGSSRISSQRALKGARVVKIDHHIKDDDYGDVRWVEEERSSVCEMVADFYYSFPKELKITKKGAECLYTGMVTDSGRFRFRGTTSQTMRLAGSLLDEGVDFERIYSILRADDFETLLFEAKLTEKIGITEHGVAYLKISRAFRNRHHISLEDASNTVSLMEHIKGSLIWIAFIENDDGTVRVRLRSRFVEIQPIAKKYHGGGHACAAGSTVYSEEEEKMLLDDADAILASFKASNPDCI